MGQIGFLTALFIWWFVYWVLFSTFKDAVITNAIFHEILWHLKVTHCSALFVFLCQSGIYIFKSLQYIYQLTSLDFHVTSGGFCCLPSGKFTPRSHPRKFLKILDFPCYVEYSPPVYWGRISTSFNSAKSHQDHLSYRKPTTACFWF